MGTRRENSFIDGLSGFLGKDRIEEGISFGTVRDSMAQVMTGQFARDRINGLTMKETSSMNSQGNDDVMV
jgi:hypothetical protein